MAVGDLSYAFNTAAGETPQTVARKRLMAEAILGNTSHAPKDIGEGLNAVGQALMYRNLMKGVTGAETAGNTGAAKVFQSLFGDQFPAAPMASATPADALAAPAADHPVPPTNVGSVSGVPGDIASGIKSTAAALGIDPVDLGTAISYETAGTFDPSKTGPTTQWGQHKGLIQFGEPQAKQYGVDWNNPVGSQLGPDGAVAKYLRDTGVKPGMKLLDIYSAINAGGVGKYDASDARNGGAPGTVRDKVEQQMAAHRAKALALLGGDQTADGGAAPAASALDAMAQGQPIPTQVASLDPSIGVAPQSAPVPDPGIMAAPGNNISPDPGIMARPNPADAKQAILQAMAGQGTAPVAAQVPPMDARNQSDLNNYKQGEARYNADAATPALYAAIKQQMAAQQPTDPRQAIAAAMAGGNGFPPELGPQDVGQPTGPSISPPELGPQDVGVTPGAPGATSPAGQRVLAAMMQQQPMSGGAPMPMQSVPPQGQQQPPAQAEATSQAAPQLQNPMQGQPGTPGQVKRGPDGQAYQYIETTGMAGATGPFGWSQVNEAALPPQQKAQMDGQPGVDAGSTAAVQEAQAQPGQPAAPLPPPTTVQDHPVAAAPQPDMSNLPVIAGGTSDAIAPGSQQGPSVQQLMQAAGDPWVMQKYGPVVEALIQQKMKQGDPGYALDLAKKKMDLQLEQQQLGGNFRGDGMEAQAWNILQTRDPSSREYQTAYSIVSQPKTQMVQTANGMVPIQVPPQLPGWLAAPGDAGGPSAAPGGAPAPGLAPSSGANAAPAQSGQSAATAGPALAGTAPQMNEKRVNNAQLYSVLQPELPIVEENWKALSDPHNQVWAGLPAGSSYLTSAPFQRASNSLKTIVASYLYSVSGATANPGEVANQVSLLTPVMGEDQTSIADKLRRIKTMVDAVGMAANGGQPIANPAASSPDASTTGGAKNKTSSGVEWSISP